MATLNIGKRWLMTLASAFFIMSWPLASAEAQPAGYTNLNVKGRVQLEIPDAWTINDAEHRKRIKDLSEKLTGIQATHTTSLSAQSFPTPSKMFVRVSFLALEPPLTPSEMRKEVQANRQQLVKELADMWSY